MFTGYNVSILEYLDQLKDVDSLNVFSFLHDEKWVDKNIEIYSKAIKAINDGTFNKIKEQLINEINKINKVSACGFLDPTKGLLHLEREVDNE